MRADCGAGDAGIDDVGSATTTCPKPSAAGALRLHLCNEPPLDITPHAGRLVLFMSREVEHEVTMTDKPRFAVTQWFWGDDE